MNFSKNESNQADFNTIKDSKDTTLYNPNNTNSAQVTLVRQQGLPPWQQDKSPFDYQYDPVPVKQITFECHNQSSTSKRSKYIPASCITPSLFEVPTPTSSKNFTKLPTQSSLARSINLSKIPSTST